MKKLLLALLITFSLTLSAQEKITALIAQDVRLLTKGSGSYDSGTLNTILRVQLEARQDKVGYTSVFAEYEYGELSPIYKRYSLNASYTFNRLFIDDLELSAYLGYGIIDRGFSKQSFGFGGSINYKLNETFKIVAVLQVIDRTDLGVLYNRNRIVTSFFIGISTRIFKTKARK